MTTIKQLLKSKGSNVWTISPDATVFEALELLAKKNIGALVVVEGESLAGIFSERDYARKVILHGKASKETKVGELMTPRVFFLHPNKTIEDCMVIMTMKRIRHIPILEEGRIIGMVTMGDVVKILISEKENKIRDLESYISGGYMS